MVALKVRVAEVLEVGDRPEAVRDRAVRAIADAVESDTKAAEAAAAALDTGAKFFVFSRSETVLSALDALDPEQLSTTVAEPGGEGVDVAESLADHVSVELGPDTAVATMLADGADAVVVGADGIDADGTVVNKVGTRTVAAVAAEAGVPVFVVASAVKCCAGVTNDEHGPIRAVYGGDAPIDVRSARFDRTPASLVSGYLTDRGRLDLEAVRELAEGHAALLDRTARR